MDPNSKAGAVNQLNALLDESRSIIARHTAVVDEIEQLAKDLGIRHEGHETPAEDEQATA